MQKETVRQTDAESFNRLVLENQEKIYALFRRMVSSHDEADDLTQETFIKVYKNLSKFRHDSSAYTWIYRIAVNTGLNFLRRRKARQTIGFEKVELAAETGNPDIADFKNEALKKVLAQLPSKQQMVIILRTYQGLAFRDIGRIMDITENAAKVNYIHALKNMRKKFEAMGVSYETV
ncbi:MAG TPA: sigma-70 family RNA polymerase sigma factor [Candidatus Marinimicrobia bacterium]|nr:sigma-70 family RNA polymerase sigma factor [Candidatus Neomarinimicrobiota bacterium]